MHKRWLPDEYVDEEIPSPTEDPTAWIAVDPDGAPRLRAAFPGNDLDAEDRRLAEGEVVAFQWTTRLGSAGVKVSKDGSFEIVSGNFAPCPVGASPLFADSGDFETMADSLAEFARCYADAVSAEGEVVDVLGWAWSDAPVRFRVEGASFVRVGAEVEPELRDLGGHAAG